MKQVFNEDFIEITKMIKDTKPFAFTRFADGEIAVMCGRQIVGSDKWTAPNYVTKLGTDLLKAIEAVDDNVYFGISCQCCDKSGKDYLLSLIKNKMENVTMSNIFVNGNYSKFIQFARTIDEPVNLIANHNAKLEYCPFKVSTFLPIPDDCVNYWEEMRDEFLELLKESYSNISGELFFISAGPMSEAIISYLWEINPTNRYVDVGSSIAEFVHGAPIREFAYAHSQYHNKNCIF
jgi:hypothetical protein